MSLVSRLFTLCWGVNHMLLNVLWLKRIMLLPFVFFCGIGMVNLLCILPYLGSFTLARFCGQEQLQALLTDSIG